MSKKQDKKKETTTLVEDIAQEGETLGTNLMSLNKQGGVKYFHTSSRLCDGKEDLLQICLESINKKSPNLGKAVFSSSEDNNVLLCIIYVPNKEENPELSIEEWTNVILANLEKYTENSQDKIKVIVINSSTRIVSMDTSGRESGAFQIQGYVLEPCYKFLVSKKLIKEDDEDELIYDF